jgi:prevent-host-death family protein
MREAGWSLQDAKNKLSEVVALAERGQPQLVTKHGRPAAYVVGVREFDALRRRARPGRSLGEHLLSFPQGGPEDFEFERLTVAPRDAGI